MEHHLGASARADRPGGEARIPPDDPTEAMGNARGRAPRHVLVPSEPVELEILHHDDERRRLLQADLLTISAGGCCLVVFHRLELVGGEEGRIRRLLSEAAHEAPRRFQVRWVQDLGEMLAIGGQYLED